MQQTLADQARNAAAQQANDRLAAEVPDLQGRAGDGRGKARGELGMVKPNEIYVQIAK